MNNNETTTRRIKFNRFGLAENPVGLTVKYGRHLGKVTSVRYDDRGYFVLTTRLLDGSVGPEVFSGNVEVVAG